jgi:hypothetical protein
VLVDEVMQSVVATSLWRIPSAEDGGRGVPGSDAASAITGQALDVSWQLVPLTIPWFWRSHAAVPPDDAKTENDEESMGGSRSGGGGHRGGVRAGAGGGGADRGGGARSWSPTLPVTVRRDAKAIQADGGRASDFAVDVSEARVARWSRTRHI